MEKEFVPYPLSLRLKALGFDEPCFGCYDEKGVFGLTVMSIKQYYTNSIGDHWSCSAPTFSQAFRWFRKKYHLLGVPTYYQYTIISREWLVQPLYGPFDSYEEAELACLDKLIEIVESKSE